METNTTKTPNDYHLSERTLAIIKKGKGAVIEADQDRIIIFTGREGSGKSTAAMQWAYKFDPTFCIDDVVFNAKDFSERIRNVKRHKAIVFDEAFNGLSSKGALSKENKNLIRILQECRQRNLYIFIVLPSIFLLEKYVAIFRSHYLVHTHIWKKNYKRRYYKVYNYNNKKLLYMLGKRYMSYSKPKINIKHSFSAKYPPSINKEEYLHKKRLAFTESEKKDVSVEEKWRIATGLYAKLLKQREIMTYREQAKYLSTGKFEVTPAHLGQLALNSLKLS